MSKLRFTITMSLDGYIAGPNQSLENGLGEGGEQLHDWVVNLKTFREMHGDSGGGETGTNDDVLRESVRKHRRDDHGPEHVRPRSRTMGG